MYSLEHGPSPTRASGPCIHDNYINIYCHINDIANASPNHLSSPKQQLLPSALIETRTQCMIMPILSYILLSLKTIKFSAIFLVSVATLVQK